MDIIVHSMSKNNLCIGIVGYGYVGKAVHKLFEDHYKIKIYDPLYRDSLDPLFVQSYEELSNCSLSIVCVPTPMGTDGNCDISYVQDAVESIPTELVLIKSTIPPHTTDELRKRTQKRIVFSPEYIGESSYYNPYFSSSMKEVPFCILGGDAKDTGCIIDLLLPVLGPTKTYFQTTSLNAEIIKYMENCYFATKVTFINEMYEICKAFGADWHQVREGWLLDPRIERMHTAIFPHKRGFSGKCYPKDLSALIEASKKARYLPKFLMEVWESNRRFRSLNNEPPKTEEIQTSVESQSSQ